MTDKYTRFKNIDDFVKLIEEFIKCYEENILKGKITEDDKFILWNIIGDAYEEGWKQADDYWTNTLFELTNAEDYFRDKIKEEI